MLQNLSKFLPPEIEEKILAFWKKEHIFERTLEKNARRKRFVFYEGPPTANGRPGIHHVLARAFKDIIPRYKTMRGFFVSRKAGWDTHGLPVELEVEKKLGLKSKREIEEFGIAEFNKKCRESVWQYKDEWERLTDRIGFWLDLNHPYVTYENNYIESIWHILKHVAKRKLLYRGHKVVPWCTRCGTALSSHELAQGYKEVKDTSVYVKFKLEPNQKIGNFKTDNNTYILSWTTTPWTLPGNVALAVGEKIVYGVVEHIASKETYILAKELIEKLFQPNEVKILGEIKGRELVGIKYEPLFDVKRLNTPTAYKIYAADFVATDEGTGVVHTAVMYGEDDYALGKKIGLPQHHTVDQQGKFTKDAPGFAGLYVKDKKTEEKIIAHLKAGNFLLKTESYTHEYPYCWRCGTALLYYARDSWFIAMSRLRAKLLKENARINWVPQSIRDGRFGEWLREVKDWAISRERYWGTPLPIWKCEKCDHEEVVGSIAELEKLQKKSTNRYILVRHGEAMNNITHVASGWPEKEKRHLTLFGRVQIEHLAKQLKNTRVDYIFSSDITRTKETEQILADAFKGEKVFFDSRLREINVGDFSNCHDEKYHRYYGSDLEKFTKRPPNGESLTDLRARMCGFIREIEEEYKGKTIVIVSHEYPLWMLETAMRGWTNDEAVREKHARGDDFYKNAEAREVAFRNVPRDETGLFDVHRPYIDEVQFSCPKCAHTMKRISEVVDVWFDSGAMPYAQAHWPFEKKIDFPADYIAEAVDQTRGWFYTLLAEAVLLGKSTPYKNVMCFGHVLDKEGQKMSKSKGNIVDPWIMIEKYGADTIRWYFYTVNPPGEPKRFDEKDFLTIQRQFFTIFYNSFVFYETYGEKDKTHTTKNIKPKNILDQWIYARLHETIAHTTKCLETYDVGGAARNIEALIDDLSRWYIRRSRRRFSTVAKGYGTKKEQVDYNNASETLGNILFTLSKLVAPFIPFFGEALYKSLAGNKLSVHLEDWPKAEKKLIQKTLMKNMEEVRRVASIALAKRAEKGIKVRQPLSELKVKSVMLKSKKKLLEILKDEVNVKHVAFDASLKEEVELDLTITHELKEEGMLRELVRTIQGFRQDAKLTPRESITLWIEAKEETRFIVEKHKEVFQREINAREVLFGKPTRFESELETTLEGEKVWIGIVKEGSV